MGNWKKNKKQRAEHHNAQWYNHKLHLKGTVLEGRERARKRERKSKLHVCHILGHQKTITWTQGLLASQGTGSTWIKRRTHQKVLGPLFFFLFSLKTQSSAVPGNVQPLNFLAESHVRKPSTCAHAKPNNLFQITKMTSKKAKHMQAFYGEPQHPTTRSPEQLAANWRQTKRSENLQRGCYSTLRVFRAEDWEWRRSPVSQGWFSPQTNCEKEAHLPHRLMNRKVSAEIRAIINGSGATVM